MLAIYRTESSKRCIAAKYKGLRYGDRRGSFSEWESEDWTSKRERERGHTYLAILVFCARDHGELLIVQHWSSGSKKRPHCCCHWWSIVVWESLSPVSSHREGMLDAGAPQEFALLTQGRNWTLLYQSEHFTARASQPWEMWGSVYTAPYCLGSKANTLYGLGRVSMTEAHPLDRESIQEP